MHRWLRGMDAHAPGLKRKTTYYLLNLRIGLLKGRAVPQRTEVEKHDTNYFNIALFSSTQELLNMWPTEITQVGEARLIPSFLSCLP